MGWIAAAIAASAAIGAGTSLYASSQAAGAAEDAALAGTSASAQGQQATLQAQRLGLEATQPFRDIGVSAGNRLSNLLGLTPTGIGALSPSKRLQQAEAKLADFDLNLATYIPLFGGPLASERRGAMITANRLPLLQDVTDARMAYTQATGQPAPGGPLDLGFQATPASAFPAEPAGVQPERPAEAPFQLSPIYNFQKLLLDRNLGRSQAARGLFMSGPGLEQSWFGDQSLSSEDINRQLTSLQNIFNVGANAGMGQANLASTTGRSLSDLISAGGLASAAGSIGQANALSGGATGVSNAITGGVGLGLQQQQSNSLLELLRSFSPGFNTGNITTASSGIPASGVNVRPGFGGQPTLLQ